jgi:SAM-dependent methyltransferase
VITPREETRIKQVYAEREGSVPRDLYSLRKPDVLYREQELERALAGALPPLEDAKILEVGCGNGARLLEFVRLGAAPENLWGVDLLPDRVASAVNHLPKAVHLMTGSAEQITNENGFFDLVLQFTAFSSILDRDVQRRVASEMLRVLRPGGTIIWYDVRFRNPWNSDLMRITKRTIIALFPGCTYKFHRITPIPPLARRFPILASALETVTLGLLTTHYLASITKNIQL